MRSVFQWNLGSRVLELGKRTLILGVLNVTPDSFSDGSLYFDKDRAVQRGLALLEEGADIVDVGGESTRPGAKVQPGSAKEKKKSGSQAAPPEVSSVTEKEELERVIPVIAAIRQAKKDALISVDTYRASVARAAIEAGAAIVNDVSGLRWDAKMAKFLAEQKCGVVIMHMRGRPEEWRTLPPIGDAVLLVKRELRQFADNATVAGIKRDRIVLDPGFGFGKKFEENYPLIARFKDLQALGFPFLVGTSRKSFIGRTLARDGKDAPPDQRLYGTLATQTALILNGAHMVRAHDVRAAAEAARIADAVLVAA